MGSNPKPDELPVDVSDMLAVGRPLVIDNYLTRPAVIDEIIDATDLDLDPAGRTLSYVDLAHLISHAEGSDGDDPETIIDDCSKIDMVQRLGSIYDFATQDYQDTLIKSQLVHILIAEAADETPESFVLPSDPDIQVDKPGDKSHTAQKVIQ